MYKPYSLKENAGKLFFSCHVSISNLILTFVRSIVKCFLHKKLFSLQQVFSLLVLFVYDLANITTQVNIMMKDISFNATNASLLINVSNVTDQYDMDALLSNFTIANATAFE